ncbi:MAG: hypothetical protein OQK98_10935 [Gammaproteobacteria bacterium]|nr:hypothetical protein [Gammaproteobacteria bacterium]
MIIWAYFKALDKVLKRLIYSVVGIVSFPFSVLANLVGSNTRLVSKIEDVEPGLLKLPLKLKAK